MTTRRLSLRICRDHRWVVVALAIGFLTRALIPAGFMPGTAGLMFCSGGMSAPMVGPAGHHHQHHPDAGQHGHAPVSAGHGEGCVFAGSAAGLAPPVSLEPLLVAFTPPANRPIVEGAPRAIPTILRTQVPRGPPVLS
jgi:hypothetical protein